MTAKRPTQYDVAKLAGVTPCTVSQILLGNTRPFLAETIARVNRAAGRLGYVSRSERGDDR